MKGDAMICLFTWMCVALELAALRKETLDCKKCRV